MQKSSIQNKTTQVDNNDNTQSLSDNVCFALYTAGNALVRAYRPLLEQCDLTYPQYLVMQALWLNDNASLTDLSKETRLDLGTLTPIVKRLETKNLLIRRVDSKDERKKIIKVTPSGIALKQEALSLKQVLLAKVSITEQQIDSLRNLCLTLTDDLNRK
ncbi:MarR family transcriptional regulator [Shewanella hanedai]|uniref:MarR family transcriptional regulator n=1 Tax=Shewanella hanedai TaxID=25 RepID=A0A553JJH5_SHEHA|nr:MarR family transcriptional regulator [Shewanella hanedai]GGI94869.1 MarR family transcriptional regulator [Shewanella hanedai]